MRLINWNISAFNKSIENALSSVLGYGSDILCFQELPQNGLNYLKKFSNYNIAYSLDTKVDRESKNVFLVILTKYKIISTGIYEYCPDKASSPFIQCSKIFLGGKNRIRAYM